MQEAEAAFDETDPLIKGEDRGIEVMVALLESLRRGQFRTEEGRQVETLLPAGYGEQPCWRPKILRGLGPNWRSQRRQQCGECAA